MLDICMVSFASEQFEVEACRTLRRYTDVPYQFTRIDNTDENRPLTRVWNEFARSSRARFVCLINPDVVFARHWASRLLDAFRMPGVVIAVPSTPSSGGSPAQRIATRGGKGDLDALAERQPALVVDDPYGVGYCYCVDRAWLESVGYFNENFPFYGQETDLNFLAFATGRRAVCVRDSIVYHYGRGCATEGILDALNEELANCFRCLKARWPLWRVQS